MEIDKISFAIKVKEYIFDIVYSKKREIKPFEYVLLKLAKDKINKNTLLVEFANEFLQIPLAKEFLSADIDWLVNNNYIVVKKNLELDELKISDLEITKEGLQVLNNNFFPSERKIDENSYAINYLTQKFIPKNELLDKSDKKLLELNFEIPFSKDLVKENIDKFINLGPFDVLGEINFKNEIEKYIELEDTIVLVDNKAISKIYQYKLPYENNINSKYEIKDINEFDIKKFLTNIEFKKISSISTDISFEIFDENKSYEVENGKLKIIFNSPNDKEEFVKDQMGSVVFLKQNFPLDNCIYINKQYQIFAANLKIPYYDSEIITFKYFTVNSIDFDIKNFIMENIEFQNKLNLLFLYDANEVLELILEDEIPFEEKLKLIQLVSKKAQFVNFKLLEQFIEENIDNIDFALLNDYIAGFPLKFIQKTKTLNKIYTNLLSNINLINEESIDNFVKLHKLYKQKFKSNQLLIELVNRYFLHFKENYPDNTYFSALKKKKRKQKKK